MEGTWRTNGLYTEAKAAGSRVLLKTGGLCPGDFDKPLIGIHNTYSEVGPGHSHLRAITEEVRAGIYQAGGVPIEFGGPGHCPKGNNAHDLPQRDIVAASIENFVELHLLDGLVGVTSCEKPTPGHWLAAARLNNIPIIIAMGGPAFHGWYKGKRINVSTVEQAAFSYEFNPSHHSLEELMEMEDCASTGFGSCALCGTANTLALLSEVLGLTIPGGGSAPAVSAKRRWLSRQTGRRIVEMVQEGLTPSAILTTKALENAIITGHALGGSSNIVIHILALAEELGIGDSVNLDLIEEWGKKIPCVANVMPSGKYSVTELDEAGGAQAVMKQVEQYLHKDALTVNGKTIGENLESVRVLDSDIIRSLSTPVFERGLAILKGNLATSAVVRYSVFPKALRKFSGAAKTFDSEQEASDAIKGNKLKHGDAIIVRYEGPRGGPGMPDLLSLIYDLYGADLADYCPIITDGRLSGFAQGPYICQVTPEAAVGGPLAVVKDGDTIEIDVDNNKLNINIPDGELQERLAAWKPKEPKVRRGYLSLWVRMANSAAKGGGLPYSI